MSYNKIQLLLISVFALMCSIYFFLGNEVIHKIIGAICLLILIGLNAYYYMNSTSWLNRKRRS